MTLIQVFPGQGSQKAGMGAGLFERFPTQVALADRVLGYSIQELCVHDPHRRLGQTEFTQPALYVVNALSFYARMEETSTIPGFLAGHSLGEYNALLAGGAFDFETGLKLVQKRGELMAKMRGGGMAAVVGIKTERLSEILGTPGLEGIDIANYNSPIQTVISGPAQQIQAAVPVLKEAGATVVPLKVSGAFHSRMMRPAQAEFVGFLAPFRMKAPGIPVVANATAAPYHGGEIKEVLSRQIASPVRWTETIRFLLRQDDPVFEEVGPGNVLTKLIQQTLKEP